MIIVKQLTKASIQTSLSYRTWMITATLTNLLYMLVIYFLWRAIYDGSPNLNGLTFEDSFLYLAISGTLYATYVTFTDFTISNDIRSGEITVDLLRPVDYQRILYSVNIGFLLTNVLFVVTPALLLIFFGFGLSIKLNSMLFFMPLVLVFSFSLSFLFDYCVGTVAFYTESIWGVITAKETIVMALSGVIVPFAFFPESIQQWLQWTPFVAIFHTPVSILLGHADTFEKCLPLILNQVIWLMILLAFSRLWFRKASSVLTVNGG